MTITHLITADELEAMGSDARFELIQGVLHEMSPSNTDSSAAGSRLLIVLGAYIYQHQLGIVTGEEGGYRAEHDPDTVIAPDIGFIHQSRMHLRISGKFFPSYPDLAVEVISNSGERADMRRKQALYDRVGTPMVWWIDPERRIATIHAKDRPSQTISEEEFLDGDSIVPGFRLQLQILFDTSPLPYL
jgi:Uma2 family endonuclease